MATAHFQVFLATFLRDFFPATLHLHRTARLHLYSPIDKSTSLNLGAKVCPRLKVHQKGTGSEAKAIGFSRNPKSPLFY